MPGVSSGAGGYAGPQEHKNAAVRPIRVQQMAGRSLTTAQDTGLLHVIFWWCPNLHTTDFLC